MKSNNIKRLEKKLFLFFSEMITYKITNSNIKDVEVTRIKLTADKSICTVYLRHETSSLKVISAIRDSSDYMRRELAKTWDMRRLPSIEFEYDKETNNVNKVLDLLDTIKNETNE